MLDCGTGGVNRGKWSTGKEGGGGAGCGYSEVLRW
jgi:hypothetical protein